MKKILTLMLAAGMLLGAASGAKAIDFKASGEWLVGFGLGDGSLIKDVDNKKRHHEDTFNAGQRVRLQLDAVASESLSGTVFFEIGDQMWGSNAEESGGALGADGKVVKVKNAYIDWMVPNTDLKLRMGLQAVAMPNVAGGSAIMDGDAAAVVASYQFNDNVGLTALWMRPLNDNYTGTNAAGEAYGNGYNNYLDNIDILDQYNQQLSQIEGDKISAENSAAYYEGLATRILAEARVDIVGHFDLITKFNEDGRLFDENDPRYQSAALDALAEQRWRDVEAGTPEYIPTFPETPYDEVPADITGVNREWFTFYATKRGHHPRARGNFTTTSSMAFMNYPLTAHIAEISPRPILFLIGDHAHSKWFSEYAYREAKEPKELYVVPDAIHIDLYDDTSKIPFDKIETFLREALDA